MRVLNQVIALEKGTKSRCIAAVDQLDKLIQKPALFDGHNKEYQKLGEDDAETFPPVRQKVQQTVDDILQQVQKHSVEMFDVVALKDWTNCTAKADVVVDGIHLLKGVPVTFLLFLEKQLTDLRTLFGRLPTLDQSEDWKWDDASSLWKTGVTLTNRSKKVVKPLLLVAPTPEHPGQATTINEDITVGHWSMAKSSGAIPHKKREELVERVEVLLKAVKEAREEANMCKAVDAPTVGKAVFEFLLRK